MKLHLLVVSYLLCKCVVLGSGPWSYNGTTPSLQSIFLGRCANYQEVDADKRTPALQVLVDCATLWNVFKGSFALKNPCQLKESDYSSFFDLVNTDRQLVNQAMFWSGTKDLVHDFTQVNTDYVTLEDTFPGYIADNLKWCGCQSCSGGIAYEMCPKNCTNSIWAFWDHASRSFAQKASGVAYVMVNGTQGPGRTAYWRGTAFSRVELVSMQNVTELKILVMFDLDVQRKEKCGTGTLVDLVADAHSRGIKTQCFDDPEFVNPILCVKYPHSQQCKLVKAHIAEAWRRAAIATIVTSSVLLVMVFILVVLICRRCTSPGTVPSEVALTQKLGPSYASA